MILIFLLSISFAVSAQVTEEQAKEKHAQALEKMLLFVLTKDITFFNGATEMIKEVKSMYESLMRRAPSNSVEKILYEAEATMVGTDLVLYGDYFKDNILKDDGKQNKKVKFMDKEHSISKEQKESFNDLTKAIKSARK